MPFSKDKLSEVQSGIRHALASTRLNDWERRFLRDMQGKLDRFGVRTRLSKRQYQRLMQLVEPAARMGASGPTWQPTRSKSGRAGAWRPILRSGLVLMVVAGFLAYGAVERFPEYMGPIVSLTASEQISGQVSHVRDGDTIEVAGVAVRFGSLDCAERDTIAGQRATARMRELVSQGTLTCYLNGRTSYDRKIGSCSLADGRDLAGTMIREGLCQRFW